MKLETTVIGYILGSYWGYIRIIVAVERMNTTDGINSGQF